MNETDPFASILTEEEYKINHCFNCNRKCLIYLLSYKVCLKQSTSRWRFLEDISITFIDKTDPWEPLERKNNGAFKSQYWRQCLRNVLRNHGLHVFGQDQGFGREEDWNHGKFIGYNLVIFCYKEFEKFALCKSISESKVIFIVYSEPIKSGHVKINFS